MAIFTKIKRLILIIEKIESIQSSTFENILTYLNDKNFKCSERTLRRDLSELKNEFGIEIICDNYHKYSIDKKNSPDLKNYLHFFEIANTASVLIENLKDAKNKKQNIEFDTEGGLKGIDNLDVLLKAINNNQEITFTHTNFIKKTQKERTLQPYLLKEYLNRWYVVGIDANNNLRNFGIDRIANIELSNINFKPKDIDTIKNKYYNVIGLEYSDAEFKEIKPQKIILSFNKIQGEYVKTLPLHHSQKITSENDNELQISLWLIPNYELKQRVLMYGNNVKVLQPKSLALEIKEKLKEAFEQY